MAERGYKVSHAKAQIVETKVTYKNPPVALPHDSKTIASLG